MKAGLHRIISKTRLYNLFNRQPCHNWVMVGIHEVWKTLKTFHFYCRIGEDIVNPHWVISKVVGFPETASRLCPVHGRVDGAHLAAAACACPHAVREEHQCLPAVSVTGAPPNGSRPRTRRGIIHQGRREGVRELSEGPPMDAAASQAVRR